MSGARESSQSLVSRGLIYSAIFLISFSGIVLEVAITRIFSAAIWYHFAFMAVAVALLGLGSAGLVAQFVFKQNFGKFNENMIIVPSLLLVVSVPFSLYVMHIMASNVSYLSVFMFLFTIPFFLIGFILSSAFTAFRAKVGRLYASDLIGASAGAVLVIVLLLTSGGEGAALITGIIAGAIAIKFSIVSKNRKKVAFSSFFASFAIILFVLNQLTGTFAIQTDPEALKDLPIYLRDHPEARLAKTQWNAFSRIDVVEGGKGDEGLVAKIFIDGGAGTNVISWDGSETSRQELTGWMHYLPFKMMTNPKVLVIGSGGGRDVVAAVISGSTDVTSVEINPLIYEIVKSYGEKAGNVYNHQYVQSYVEEGRSFITRSQERFDMIYIPFVDTWASVSTGGLGVSENFLYTLEGFQQYYDHLTDRGKIVTVRWLIDTPRFVSTYVKLLEQKGVPQDEVYRHLIVVTADSYDQDPSGTMVVFSKSPFTETEIGYYQDRFERFGYKSILIPDRVTREPYTQLLNGSIGLDDFYGLFSSKAHYVTDDSPYFLSYEKPVPRIVQDLLHASFVIVALFISIPFAWLSKKSRKLVFSHDTVTMISYFASLGMGFILIELSLLQKLTLMLGNPTATFAILLFTLLLSSGCGSFLSVRYVSSNVKKLAGALGGIITICLVYLFALQSVINAVMIHTFEIKVIASFAILIPVGILMGMPFPTGIRLITKSDNHFISWIWALNGAFSVLGSVLAVYLAITSGSSWAMALGVVIYGVALAIMFIWKGRHKVGVGTEFKESTAL